MSYSGTLKSLILFSGLSLCCAACFNCDEDADPTRECNMAEPFTELAWLAEESNGIETMSESLRPYFYIASGHYKNQDVFVFSDCCPNCDTISEVKDCSGRLIGLLQADIPMEEINDFKVIYGGSVCDF